MSLILDKFPTILGGVEDFEAQKRWHFVWVTEILVMLMENESHSNCL